MDFDSIGKENNEQGSTSRVSNDELQNASSRGRYHPKRVLENIKNTVKNARNNGSSEPPQIETKVPPGVYVSTDRIQPYQAKSQTNSTANLVDTIELQPSDGKVNYDGDENKERGNWSGKLDFLLSCLGFAVGLGNVWRFPYLCYRNGGGAFFIPYVIMLTFVGIPLFFLELSLGQFCSNGPLTCWGYSPLFKGIGIAMVVVSTIVSIYYNVIIAWAIFYLFSSFTGDLPWQHCDREWNTPDCILRNPIVNCNGTGQMALSNGTCYGPDVNGTLATQYVGIWNETIYKNVTSRRLISASEEYYNHRVLKMSSGIEESSLPHWELVLSLLGAWTIVFFCLIKGIKSSGKVVYFTALFPYVVLIILFFRGVTLPNAGEGVYFYVVPKWERLLDARVWNDAAIQIFFSLSNCWGGLITLASYNRFHNSCLRDTLIVCFGNCGTSVFAGFVIFSFLGFMAGQQNTSVDKVASSGAGLAFIIYPEAITSMPISPLWAVLFFIMLLTLGLDSQFAMMETVVTALIDQFPNLLRPLKTWVILVISITMFLLGLTLCTSSGVYWLQLMDSYGGGWALSVIGLCETISIGWIYGSERFMNDIRIMTGKMPSIWWRICWQGITPLLIVAILLFAWIDYSPARYGDYTYPGWADAIGWCMSFASVIFIPIMAIHQLFKEEGRFVKRLFMATRATKEWGPALVQHRMLVDYVDDYCVDPSGEMMKQSQTTITGTATPKSYSSFPNGASIMGSMDTLDSASAMNRSVPSLDHIANRFDYGHANKAYVPSSHGSKGSVESVI